MSIFESILQGVLVAIFIRATTSLKSFSLKWWATVIALNVIITFSIFSARALL